MKIRNSSHSFAIQFLPPHQANVTRVIPIDLRGNGLTVITGHSRRGETKVEPSPGPGVGKFSIGGVVKCQV
jgi:hypothetical protein